MPIVDGLIRLFEISDGGLPSPLRFCNYSESDGSNVQFGGNSYIAYPIESSSGWERTQDGALPRPTIALSNLFGDVSGIIRDYGGIGAQVIRRTVPIKNLDNGSDPDPTATIKAEYYYVNRFVWNNQRAIIHLRSPLDEENLRLPRRTVGSLLA